MYREIEFGGLSSTELDGRIPIDKALSCDDCYVDGGAPVGRNGYRAATAAAIVGAGTSQFVGRMRTSPTAARTVAVIAGSVYNVQDPASETASNGTVSAGTAAFGATAAISGAQLAGHLYLGTDEAAVAARRIKSDYTLETLQDIQPAVKPALGAFPAVAFTLFNTITNPNGTADVSGVSQQTIAASNWLSMRNVANTDGPATGAWIQYNLGANNIDATSHDLLAVGVTPDSTNTPNGAITVQVGTGTAAVNSIANIQTVGVINDGPRVGGSPNVIFCDLTQIPTSVRNSIRYIRFLFSGSNGAVGGAAAVYGWAFLPAKPIANPQKYTVTCQDAVTLQESKPSPDLEVTISDTDKLTSGKLTYQDLYIDNRAIKNTNAIIDAFAPNSQRVSCQANNSTPGIVPKLGDIGAVVSITITLHSSWVAGQVLRLWKDTSTGRRLILTYTLLAADITAGTKVLVDTGGLGVLSNTRFKPGGTLPRTSVMCAHAGRLVCAYQNRVYVSSFTPPSDTTDPFPQFPDVAIERADGWSFDVGASYLEQFLTATAGDHIYLGSNEAVYVMPSLTPDLSLDPAPPIYRILARGVMGRRAALWMEDQFVWAAYDGIYWAVGRSQWGELTQDYRRQYIDWFQPDSTVMLRYQSRKLYAFRGTRYIRYDFVTKKWSRGTVAHTFVHGADWHEPFAALNKASMWMLTSDRNLMRWQPDYAVGSANKATTDAGTAIPAWVYETGFETEGQTHKITDITADADGVVDIVGLKSTDSLGETRILSTTKGLKEVKFPGDLKGKQFRLRMSGANGVTLSQLFMKIDPVDAEGG